MATIDISGRVQYPPGPWGLARPVAGAQLEMRDLDLDGKHDSLWTGRTDNTGNFHAVSDASWRDKIKIFGVGGMPPRPIEKWVDDPTDVLTVQVKIRADNREVLVPLMFSNGAVPAPMVVPWLPTATFAKVDGQTIHTGPAAYAAIQQRVDAGQGEIQIEVYGPEVMIFEPLTRTSAELRAWLQSRTGIAALTGGEVAVILLAIAVIILAVAALTAVFLFGLAVLYAIHKNYEAVDWEITFDPTTGQPTLKTKLRKRA